MGETPQIDIIETDNEIIVTGGGMLDITNSEMFLEGLKSASSNADNVIVDLKLARFIDTAIIQCIGSAAVRMMKRGEHLKVVVENDSYSQKVIRTVGFDQLVDVVAE